jgi:heptosyltransferase-2
MTLRNPIDKDTGLSGDSRPIVVFGYPGVGDFVRCHSLVRMISHSFPDRPIDVVGRKPAIEIAAFMPEIREAIVENFAHRRLDLRARLALAGDLRKRKYGTAYIIPSSFKAAMVPFLAQIPERIGWAAEFRLPLINKPRFRMHRAPRMVDRIGLLSADSHDASLSAWPEPRLRVPASLQDRFHSFVQEARSAGPVVTLGPGSSDPNKNWPIEHYVTVARHCIKRGCSVWVVGSSAEGRLAAAIGQQVRVQDRTMDSLTSLALAVAASDVFVGNDSGPLHIAAGLDKPSVGIFGITDPWYSAPINSAAKIPMPDRSVAHRTRTESHWPTPEQVIRCLDGELDRVPKLGGEAGAAAGRSDRFRESAR